MSITVLLADDTPIMRNAIRLLLTEHPEIEIVGEATDFTQTIAMTHELKPHVVILDLHMPNNDSRLTPTEVSNRLQSSAAWILAMSVWNDDDTKAMAKKLGAATLLDKMRLNQELIPAVMSLASPDVLSRGATSRSAAI